MCAELPRPCRQHPSPSSWDSECSLPCVVTLWVQTFWHSSSHILGEALESQFGVDLTIGPAIEEGFYYDCFLDDGRTLGEADKPTIEKRIQEVS